jgi:hypothetical protein
VTNPHHGRLYKLNKPRVQSTYPPENDDDDNEDNDANDDSKNDEPEVIADWYLLLLSHWHSSRLGLSPHHNISSLLLSTLYTAQPIEPTKYNPFDELRNSYLGHKTC